ncbi:MAG: sigma-70 family RNA polymerase sigma factor [Planctomycetes bacterium]|nr:sigma-70 family RNA polymerase sigma factor [Planctomycetota bacterium]
MKDREIELIHKAQKGDGFAFEQLVSSYDKQVLSLAYSIVGHPDDAKDIYQEALFSAYKALPKFRMQSAFFTWLYRIAVNKAINFKRKKLRYQTESITRSESESYGSDRDLQISHSETPEEVTIQKELKEAAQLYEQACQVNPEDYQAPILLGMVYNGLGRKAQSDGAYRRGLQVAQRHLELHPDDARALYLGASALCQLGERGRSLDWARRALMMGPEEPSILYNVACVYALQGQGEEAIDCLEKAITFGFAQKEWIDNDADLNSLRSHPRFRALMQRL